VKYEMHDSLCYWYNFYQKQAKFLGHQKLHMAYVDFGLSGVSTPTPDVIQGSAVLLS
jgi:hypothetical protein